MRVQTCSALLLLTSLYLIIAFAMEVFIDDYIKPSSLFTYFIINTILSIIATTFITIDIPN